MLRDNPFYIFEIPMDASKERVMAAAERQSLRSDSGNCDRMAEMLVKPAIRLEAELGWFPQEDEETIRAILEAVKREEPVPDVTVSGLSELGKLNVEVYELSLHEPSGWNDSFEDRKRTLDAIGKHLYSFFTDDLLTAINEERREAGISELDRYILRTGASEKRKRVEDDLSDLIGKMTDEQELTFMNLMADSFASGDRGDVSEALLFCALAERFETRISAKYVTLTEELNAAIDRVNKPGGFFTMHFRRKRYNEKMSAWLRYDKPLHVAAALSGFTRDESMNMLCRCLGLISKLVSVDGPVDCYEFLNALEEQFAAVPCAKELIAENKEKVGKLIKKLLKDTPENAIRKRNFERKSSKFTTAFLIVMFLFFGFAMLTTPSEFEQANDPSSSVYKEMRLSYEIDPHGEFKQIRMPLTGFIFQDTMGDEGRSVTVILKGDINTSSFVRISDRDYGDETYIFLPDEEVPIAYKLPLEDEKEIKQDDVPPDAKILSVMVKDDEETEITLPPGEYYLSHDYGYFWYGWRLRFSGEQQMILDPYPKFKIPEMKPMNSSPVTFESGKKYIIRLEQLH